ncbi:MAG: plasmid mobilization protein [Ilumatobacteraceae bacterium]
MSNQEPDNIDAAMDKVAETMKPTRKKSTGAKEDDAALAQVIVRTTDEERERWKNAAAASGMSMSEWIRSLCTKEAGQVLECQHPQNMRLSYPWSETCLKCGKRLRG